MKTVLLISDDNITYEQVRFTCMDLDVEVVHTKDTAEGITLAREINPMMIFVDAAHKLSHNGWLTASFIKSDRKLRDIPVIVLSDADVAEQNARKVRCDYYLPRQFPIRETRAQIASLLGVAV